MTIALCLSILPIAGIVYFLYSYFSQPGTPYNPLRGECLIGAEMIQIYTWPLWVAIAGMGIGFRKKLKSDLFALSLLPILFMLASFILIKIIG